MTSNMTDIDTDALPAPTPEAFLGGPEPQSARPATPPSPPTPASTPTQSGPTAAQVVADAAKGKGKQKDDGAANNDDEKDEDDSSEDVEVATKPPDLRRVVPTGVPIPSRGIARFDYLMWQRRIPGWGCDYQPPQLGKKEFFEYRAKRELIDELVSELRALALTIERIIAVMNSKGGSGKSPLAANLVTILQWVTDLQMLLVDANENDGSGHHTLGIPRERTYSVRYVMHHLEEFSTYKQLLKLGRLEVQGKGPYLIASDPGAIDDFDMGMFIKMLIQLLTAVHSIVIDGGNGNTTRNNEGSVIASTDLVISTLADDSETFQKAITTLAAHFNRGHQAQVTQAFIAVSATHTGDTRDKYFKRLKVAVSELTARDVSLHGDAIPHKVTLDLLGIEPESIHLIPFDQHIRKRGVADVVSLQLDTIIAELQLLIAIFKQNAPAPSLEQLQQYTTPSPGTSQENTTKGNDHV